MFERNIGEYKVSFDGDAIVIKGPHDGQSGGCLPSFGRNADPMVFIEAMSVEDCDRYCDFYRGTRDIGRFRLTCRGKSIAVEYRKRFRSSMFGYLVGSDGDYYNQRDAFDAVCELDCRRAVGVRERKSILSMLIEWVTCK